MEHHHEPTGLDETTKAMKRYWFLPRVYEFETEIREINEDQIRLQENYFYPEGGGQPSDRGVIQTDKGRYDVVDVQEEDNIVWLHLSEHSLEEGMSLSAKIDDIRRETLTRNHSAQHLLSAVFWDEFELETSRALIDMKETEIELHDNPTMEQINKAINIADQFVEAKLPIESLFYSEQELDKANIRGEVQEDHMIYRLVKIGSIDLNACGGTHLEHTGLIDNVAIQKIDGKRLKFLTGTDAKEFISNNITKIHRISKDLGVPVVEIENEVNRLYSTNKALQKELYDLKNDLIKTNLKNLHFNKIGEFEFSHTEVSELNRGVILDSLGMLEPNQVNLVTNQEAGFVLTTGTEDLTADLMTALRNAGVRGGGRGTTVMGTADSVTMILDNIREFLQSKS